MKSVHITLRCNEQVLAHLLNRDLIKVDQLLAAGLPCDDINDAVVNACQHLAGLSAGECWNAFGATIAHSKVSVTIQEELPAAPPPAPAAAASHTQIVPPIDFRGIAAVFVADRLDRPDRLMAWILKERAAFSDTEISHLQQAIPGWDVEQLLAEQSRDALEEFAVRLGVMIQERGKVLHVDARPKPRTTKAAKSTSKEVR